MSKSVMSRLVSMSFAAGHDTFNIKVGISGPNTYVNIKQAHFKHVNTKPSACENRMLASDNISDF